MKVLVMTYEDFDSNLKTLCIYKKCRALMLVNIHDNTYLIKIIYSTYFILKFHKTYEIFLTEKFLIQMIKIHRLILNKLVN